MTDNNNKQIVFKSVFMIYSDLIKTLDLKNYFLSCMRMYGYWLASKMHIFTLWVVEMTVRI